MEWVRGGGVKVRVGFVPWDIVAWVEEMKGDCLWCRLQGMREIRSDPGKRRDGVFGDCGRHGDALNDEGLMWEVTVWSRRRSGQQLDVNAFQDVSLPAIDPTFLYSHRSRIVAVTTSLRSCTKLRTGADVDWRLLSPYASPGCVSCHDPEALSTMCPPCREQRAELEQGCLNFRGERDELYHIGTTLLGTLRVAKY